MPRIALIHALAHSVAPINEAFAQSWPDAVLMNLLDDSLSTDLARGGKGLDDAMHRRFAVLGDYAVSTGADAILFTCSAFGPCIEAVARRHAAIPVLKPNEAMIEEACRSGARIGTGRRVHGATSSLASISHSAAAQGDGGSGGGVGDDDAPRGVQLEDKPMDD